MVDVLDERVCILGEGPAFDFVRNRLWWVDILGRRILWQDLVTKHKGSFGTSELVGAVIIRQDGNLSACLPQSLVTLDAINGALIHSMDMPANHIKAAVPLRMNDAKCAPGGQLYAGSMFVEEIPGCEGASALYQIAGDRIQAIVEQVTLSNGLGWSPDGATMYYIDTRTQRIDRFDFEAQQGPKNRRPFVFIDDLDGNPDGLCVDKDGGIWVALWGGAKVHRYDERGRLSAVIPLPTQQPTSVCFYGEGLASLAITTAGLNQPQSDVYAGRTFTIEPGVSGCEVSLFAG